MKKLSFLAGIFLAIFCVFSTVSAYTVVSGDSLWKIAQKANLGLSRLINLNPQIENPNLIYPGQEINISGYNMDLPYFQKLGSGLLGGNNINFVQVQNLYLSGSGISSTANSIGLTSFEYPNGDKVVMTDFGDIGYAVIEPDTSREENISFTGITQLASGKATLTGVSRGLGLSYPYTASTSLAFNHAGGTILRISNTAPFYNEFNIKGKDETITGKWIFNVYPEYKESVTATTANQFITKLYADNLINQGAATSSESIAGISELATQVEMASSTWYGLLTPTVLQSRYATSSPNQTDNAGLWIPISQNDGYLSWNWLDRSDALTWSGDQTWSGNNSFTSTTTFTGNMSYRGFGGVGTDGALSISAGATTTLDANYTNVLVKNYSSINIPNTAGLTIENASTTGTILILKSQGDCNIAGNIWLKGFGAATSSATTTPFGVIDVDNKLNGRDDGGEIGASGGNRISSSTLYLYTTGLGSVFNRSMVVVPGAHGGRGSTGGGVSGGAGGYGGSGGGAIIIECGGYLNFTGSIVVDGGNGLNGSDGGAASAGGGGGGGGAAGMALVLYNNLIANTGTIYARGGSGGDGGDAGATSLTGFNAGGGGAGCWSSAGFNGANQDSSGEGRTGTATTNACGAGGGSGSGDNGNTGGAGGAQGATDPHHYYIGQNYWF